MNIKFTSVKGGKHNKLKPCIKVNGKWLADIGFCHKSFFTLKCSQDNIHVKLCRISDISNIELLNKIRKKDEQSIFFVGHELRGDISMPNFLLSGNWLEKFGFKMGSYVAIRYEYGIIKIKRLEFDEE